MNLEARDSIRDRLARCGRLRLFLDYDGTLADLAPTPDHVLPDPEVIALVTRLSQVPNIRLAVISGRRLAHVRRLLPVPGILLAGTYGIELQTPEGQQVDRLPYDEIRPTLESLKPRWQALIETREGFFLEDKGWSLALHARYAADQEAARVLEQAREEAGKAIPGGLFRILGGHKFLEVGPTLAHKGRTVRYLLAQYPFPDALPLYLGDDDKDEEAFEVIHNRGGIAILVAAEPRPSAADWRLPSPQQARRWLARLPDRIGT